ncbi:MAG: hypothetical protein K2R93_06485 [Gemmatimonadaceae bacterium]|nr:hypothetical protein [Gemmatimonadaceae bacterium]
MSAISQQPVRRISVNVVRKVLALASLVSLAACHDSTTAPELTQVRPRRDMVCVQFNAAGEIVSIQSVNASGGCADGFDLHIWI